MRLIVCVCVCMCGWVGDGGWAHVTKSLPVHLGTSGYYDTRTGISV